MIRYRLYNTIHRFIHHIHRKVRKEASTDILNLHRLHSHKFRYHYSYSIIYLLHCQLFEVFISSVASIQVLSKVY